MNAFTVVDVLDDNTLVVSPPWRINSVTGSALQVHGIAVPPKTTAEGHLAHCSLSVLLLGCQIHVTHICEVSSGVVQCDIEYQGVPLPRYFPRFNPPEKPDNAAEKDIDSGIFRRIEADLDQMS